mgnify:CR=1 FL=1
MKWNVTGRPSLSIILASTIAAASAVPAAQAVEYMSPTHEFSINDIQGAFNGSTFGAGGAVTDNTIICDAPGGVACPPTAEVGPVIDKQGVTLYPIDSEFGFYIVDFLGAAQKFRDNDYLEGWAGDFTDLLGPGLKVSNQATDTYKVKPPFGTWCRGLGGNSVKCETEHYSVMEHTLSCHEVIPYLFADPVSGAQEVQSFNDLIPPDYPNVPPYELPAQSTFDCALAGLDDAQYVVSGGLVTDTLLTSNQSPPEGQMFPNDLTTVLDNYSVSKDYTIPLKADGKPDYHWGTLIKRPNDIRMYARFDVPPAWNKDEAPAQGYAITKALLYVDHWITNNPNDQLRPEDIENEAATGRKPSYRIDPADPASPDPAATVWKSTVPCYEGDADIIDTEEGGTDPTFIGTGTYLKNTPYAYTDLQVPDPCDAVTGDNCFDPQPLSSDLTGGFTNAFYTSINRDPFEWSYRPVDSEPNEFNFIGCAGPVEDPAFAGTCQDDFDNTYDPVTNPLVLVSGPRWRLKANKFGQDLPGLEIPAAECSPPPFERDNIKYEVGEPTTTVINLLDWADENGNGIQDDSPLANSLGWVDLTVVPVDPIDPSAGCTLLHNPAIEIVNVEEGTCNVVAGEPPITNNGMPITDGFDLAVYVKGDRKSTALYNAKLVIEYLGAEPPPEAIFDMELTSLVVPARVGFNTTNPITVTVTNLGPDTASGLVTLVGVDQRPETDDYLLSADFSNLLAGASTDIVLSWTTGDAPAAGRPQNVDWTATVVDQPADTNPANDQATARSQVVPNP